jgi:acyl dehydratase
MDVEIGQEIPTFERMSGFHAWNRYAAVNDEFVPIHMDDEAGRNAGQPGAFGMGNLQVGYLHAMLSQWFGDEGRVVRLGVQFRAPNIRGLRTIAGGKVTGVREENGEKIVELDVWTKTEEGTPLAPGTATVALRA